MKGGKRTVLITGASTGLGLAISRQLITQTKYRLILTSRETSLHRFQAEGIQETADVFIRPLDVTEDSQRRAVIYEAEDRWGGLEVLINNAGVAYRTVVEHFTNDAEWDEMDVNFAAPMELIRLALPGMRKNRCGQIINISSVGGMMAMPTMALYSASKFALEGASESLWYEVRPWGITVTLVEPGFINSDSFQNTQYTERSKAAAMDQNNPYYQHYRCISEFIALLMKRSRSTPERVAKKVVRLIGAANPPLRVAGTFDALIFSVLRRVLPRGLYHQVLYSNLPKVKTWGGPAPGQQVN